MFETRNHHGPRLLISMSGFLFFVALTSIVCRTCANPPSFAKQETESASLDNPFPDSPRDRGVPVVRGMMKETNSTGQFTFDFGFVDGLREGYFLGVSRNEKIIDLAEIVEVFEKSCRCLTELSLESGDEIALAMPTRVHGRCLDGSNRPIEGVTIALFRSSMNMVDPPSFIASTKTVDDGSFQLPACDVIPFALSRTDILLVARKEGYVSKMEHLNRGQEELLLNMTDDVASLVGIVLGPNGDLISDAQVRLTGLSTRIDGVGCAKTDSKGKYLLTDLAAWSPNVPQNAHRKLIVSHPEFGESTVSYFKTPAMVNVRLKLPAIVQGKVVDQVTGEPVRHGIVSAQGVHEKGWYQTRTDGDGRYELRMIPDKYNIWAEMHDRMPIAINSIEAVAGKTQPDANIQMVRGGVIYGKLLTEENVPLNPEARSLVAHHGPARPISGAAVTSTTLASDGSFRLRVAPGKNYVYSMSHGSNASANVEVAEGQEVELNLRLGNHRVNQRPAIQAAKEVAR